MRILHTMLRVGNLDRAIAFYTWVLGMKLLRRKDYPGGKFTLAFVGFQDEAEGAVLELTYNWGVEMSWRMKICWMQCANYCCPRLLF